jgi:hypothetical protein
MAPSAVACTVHNYCNLHLTCFTTYKQHCMHQHTSLITHLCKCIHVMQYVYQGYLPMRAAEAGFICHLWLSGTKNHTELIQNCECGVYVFMEDYGSTLQISFVTFRCYFNARLGQLTVFEPAGGDKREWSDKILPLYAKCRNINR